MMKKPFLFILLLCLIPVFGFRPAESGPANLDPCLISNLAFQEGESVIYTIYYNLNFVWVPAGEVEFRVKGTDRHLVYQALGDTYDSYEWFFKVRDRYESRVDKQTLLPVSYIRDIQEGDYRSYEKVDFDQGAGFAFSHKGRERTKLETTRHTLQSCMHDMLSIIYYCRNVDFNKLKKGDSFQIQIFLDKEVWPLNVKYYGKDARKKIRNLGVYKALEFSPETIKGTVFSDNNFMRVWVSDDENRVPLLIESPVSVGSIKAVLKSCKGLKYDLKPVND